MQFNYPNQHPEILRRKRTVIKNKLSAKAHTTNKKKEKKKKFTYLKITQVYTLAQFSSPLQGRGWEKKEGRRGEKILNTVSKHGISQNVISVMKKKPLA